MYPVNLQGRTALITGASRGLGRATALLLAQAGADVVVHYHRHRNAAHEVVRACQRMGVRALAVRADMASWSEITGMFREVIAAWHRLDILVANAGIWNEAAIDRLTERRLNEMLAVNVKGVFACCQQAVRIMKRQRAGRIILVSSTAGQRGEAYHAHYAASKGAIISLTKSLAPELADHNILVNCIAPGWFATDMAQPSLSNPEIRRQVLKTIPLGRVGRPEEFAGVVLFLASDLATFVTGEILNVNGGAVLIG